MIKIVYIFLFLPLIGFSQHDTVKLFKLIPTSDEFYAHKKFWNYIHYRDQGVRSSSNIEKIDEEDLILVCEYFNRFGYPNFERLGKTSTIINTVWWHNRFSEIDQLTFPLVMKAFQMGTINEEDYRGGYINQLYRLKYDNKENMTLPLDSIYKILQVIDTNSIDINLLLKKFEQYKIIKADTAKLIGEWFTDSSSHSYYLNGKEIVVNQESIRICIFQSSDSIYYFVKNLHGNPIDQIKLEATMSRSIFKEANRETDRFYKVMPNGNLYYTDEQEIIYKEYLKKRPITIATRQQGLKHRKE